MNKNLEAFLRVIREGESSQDDKAYRTLVGGTLFDSFEDHPNQRIFIASIDNWSTAAGAYQFLYSTWKGLQEKYKYPDFSPQSQDQAAIDLIREKNALQDIYDGNITDAVLKLNRTWASLPGSPYGQPTITWDRVHRVYEKYGGKHGLQEEGQRQEEQVISKPATKEVSKMAAPNNFVNLAFQELLGIFPGIFAANNPEDAKSQQVVNAVVNAAKTAIGAENEQELVQKVKADPVAAVTVKERLTEMGFIVEEAGGGGIKAARELNQSFLEPKKGFWNAPAFVVTVMLLPLAYLVVWNVLTDTAAWSPDIRAAVVSAIISGVLGSITGYWLGTSISSARKDLRQ